MIQGAASGGTTTKYEYAYPGEIHEQVYLRVHPVDGPIFSYVDLLEENVSPDATADPDEQPATDTVAYVYEEREDNGELETYMLDKVNGVPAVDTSAFNFGDWHQVSTKLGSILFRKGAVDFPQGVESSYKYVDTDEKTWTDGAQGIEREVETGDFGATQWRFSNPLPDTQSCSCVHQSTDKMVALLERSYVILSSGEAGSGSGDEEDDDRTSEFSVSIEEEKFESDPDPPDPPVEPCKPELGSPYGDDGGDPELHAELSPCTNATGWNLYRSQGAGVTERLASLPPGAVYRQRTLALGAEATYYAAALGPGGTEGEFSEPVTIQHIDTVPPEPAIDVQAEAAPGTITVSWLQPQDPGLAAYKIRVATTSGGPYTLAAEGAELRSSNRVERTFVASGGQTYYVVVVLRDHAGNERAPSVEVPVEVP